LSPAGIPPWIQPGMLPLREFLVMDRDREHSFWPPALGAPAQAGISRIATVAGSLLAILTVTGQLSACSRDSREADVKQCVATALRETSQTQTAYAAESVDERHDRLGGQIAACMENLGYNHDDGSMTDERCVDDVDFNPYCYRRKS